MADEVERLRDDIDELFADLWQVSRMAGRRSGFRPAVNCIRTSDPPVLNVVIELAGIDPADVRLVASSRRLLVAGQRRRPVGENQVYQRMEIEYGPFEREIQLADEVDPEAAHASYSNGLLTVVLPIAERSAGSVRVAIEFGGRR